MCIFAGLLVDKVRAGSIFLSGVLLASVLITSSCGFTWEKKGFAWGCDPLIFLGAKWCLQVTVTLLVASSQMGFVQGDMSLKCLSNLTPFYNNSSATCRYLCINSFSPGSPKLGRASAHPVWAHMKQIPDLDPKGCGVTDFWMIADMVLVQKPWVQGFGHLPREILPWLPIAPCRA